jgi:hypothetical protein
LAATSAKTDPIFWKIFEETLFTLIIIIWRTFLQIFSHPHLWVNTDRQSHRIKTHGRSYFTVTWYNTVISSQQTYLKVDSIKSSSDHPCVSWELSSSNSFEIGPARQHQGQKEGWTHCQKKMLTCLYLLPYSEQDRWGLKTSTENICLWLHISLYVLNTVFSQA